MEDRTTIQEDCGGLHTKRVKLISSDLNGTLVHQHTMSDMIRLYLGQEQFEKAITIFNKQTSGEATMQEAFDNAGPLTKGLTLRQAIEYVKTHMVFINGFDSFVNSLQQQGIFLVINSTGYSVTIYAIMAMLGGNKIHGQIGNFLEFGIDGNPHNIISEEDLKKKVEEYFEDPSALNNPIYDKIMATGVVSLGICDERAKKDLILNYAQEKFNDIKPEEMVHIGDTMGDSEGILGIAKDGGVGIAFNYNAALKNFLDRVIESESILGEIYFVDIKSKNSDLRKVLLPVCHNSV